MYHNLILKQQELKKIGYKLAALYKKNGALDKILDILDAQYRGVSNTINLMDIERINKTKSDIFIFHNHNLAYYCWKKFFLDGKIKKDNLLLHVDSHRDIRIPNPDDSHYFNLYSEELKKAENKIKAVEKYVLDVLWINDYIFPTIKEKFINEIIWIEPQHLNLGIGPNLLRKVFFDPEKMGFTLKEKGSIPIKTLYAEDLLNEQIKNKKIILNIDMDYFSCKEEPKNISTEEDIKKSISNLFFIFEKIKIKPKIVTIALSPNYVPYNRIEFIQNMIKEKLFSFL